jgi:hypothetical protein
MPIVSEADLDQRIEQAFRDVLRKAIAWRMITDDPDQVAVVDYAARELHAAVVEYEAAMNAWTGPIDPDGSASPAVG